MKVGDLVRFTETDFLGTIVQIEEFNCAVYVHGAPSFTNPTWFRTEILLSNSEMVNESR